MGGNTSKFAGSFNDDQDLVSGARVAKLVLPAQQRPYTSAHEAAFQQRRTVLCDENNLKVVDEKISSGDFSLAVQSLLPEHPEKVIVYFVGNGEFYQDRLDEMLADHEATGAAIIGFNYPNVADSSNDIEPRCLKDLVDASLEMIQHVLKSTGLDADDVIFKTHSLGGAIGTRTAATLHALEQPVFLFNGRSFANINKVIAEPATSSYSTVTVGTSTAGWGSKPAEDYASIPDEYKTFITAENDPIIQRRASMLEAKLAKTNNSRALMDEHMFSPKGHLHDQHNCSLTNLFNAKGQSAQEYFLEFFAHACELKQQKTHSTRP